MAAPVAALASDYSYTPVGNVLSALAAVQDDPEALTCALDTQQADENHGSCQLLPNVVRWRAGKLLTIKQDWGSSASTGAAVWNGANMAAWYLENTLGRDRVAGSHVVELGAGVGFTSLVAHALGAAEVAITDGSAEVLELARDNIALNVPADQRAGIYTAQLRWNTPDEGTFRPAASGASGASGASATSASAPWDYVIAADVTYLKKNRADLVATMAHLSGPQTVALLSMEPRNVGEVEDVLQLAEKAGFAWTEERLPIDREKEQCGLTCARLFALRLVNPPAVAAAAAPGSSS